MGYLHDAFSLEGKTALVKRPGTGIGQGIAKALAGAGADIIGTSHKSSLSETQQLVEQERPDIYIFYIGHEQAGSDKGFCS